MLPKEVDNGIVMPEGEYTIMKIGNRDNPENYNQAIQYRCSGPLLTNIIKPGEVVIMGGGYFNTSRIRSIYIHETDSGFDKLVLPEGWPVAKDFRLPFDLKAGDVILGTMNSVYLLTTKRDLPDEFGDDHGHSFSRG